MYINLDLETTSGADLLKTGVYVYADDPGFAIQLMAYSINGGEVQQIDFTKGEKIPGDLAEALLNPKVIKRAYNAAFERICLSQHLLRDGFIDPEGWECTSVRSSASGLPASLDEVCKALGMDSAVAKKDGKRLIKLFAIAGADPEEYPKEWEAYKAYNRNDVIAEMHIRERIDRECPFTDQEVYVLDQRINDRGVRLDAAFVSTVLGLESKRRDELEKLVKGLTFLHNANSPLAFAKWISMHLGIDVTSANKDTLAEIKTDDPIALQVLAARRELSLSSVKKFAPMQKGTSGDGRIRGLFRCYGAGRTGRWSSVRVQLQNLAKGDGKLNISIAKEIVGAGNYPLLSMCYDEPMKVLSTLVRPSLIASPDNELVIGDFSSIEARIIAWLANEKWVLDVFKGHGAIYETAAARMYHRPVEEIIAGCEAGEPLAKDQRAKGKVATLACIAEGQKVLTDRGLIPIQNVLNTDLLWDGTSWVSHEGVIFKGFKKTLRYEGLTATSDHLVWVEGQPGPIPFGVAATCNARLLKSGSGRQELRLGKGYQPGTEIHKGLESGLRFDGVHRLRSSSVAIPVESVERRIEWLSDLFTTEAATKMARQTVDGCETTLPKCERSSIPELRGKRYRIPLRFHITGRAISATGIRTTRTQIGSRPNRQRRPLRSRKYSVYHAKAKRWKSSNHGITGVETGRLALCTHAGSKNAFRRIDTRANYRKSLRGGSKQTEKLAGYTDEVAVYDILNAGPNNRFTVSDVLVHNCGYQGAVGALTKMGGGKMGLSTYEMQQIVNAWRLANPAIVRLWSTIEACARHVLTTGRAVKGPKGLIFRYDYRTRIMSIQLPSGRCLYYRDVALYAGKISYSGYSSTARVWGKQDTYGGKLAENITQSIARDILAEAMLRAENEGFYTVMHVHDEIVADMPSGNGYSEELKAVMVAPPIWAEGLPLAAKVETSYYYTK